MTSVDGSSRAQPPRSVPTRTAAADPGDARAMREAIDAARGRLDKPVGQQGRKAPPGPMAKHEGARDAGLPQPAPAQAGTDRPATRWQSRGEGTESLGAWNGAGAGIVPTTVAADFPAAHVDPGGFAQMLADLWTRENGRGSKEVRVRFGDRAWPATGARLTRNAAGTLDVALEVGDGGRVHADKLSGLADALTRAGVDLGSLAIEDA